MKRSWVFAMLLASMTAGAQTTDGVIVKSGDTEHSFAISDIREITFDDNGMTVVKTDELTVSFADGWQIRFGQVDATGIALVGMSGKDTQAQVFDTNGALLRKAERLSQLQFRDLPKGIYIIKCNGKSLKIQK